MLFHGTKNKNVRSILKDEIRPEADELQANGGSYGFGVYFTQDMSIATLYGNSVFAYEVILDELELTNDNDEFIVKSDPNNILVPRLLFVFQDINKIDENNDKKFYSETLRLLNRIKEKQRVQPEVHDVDTIPVDYFKSKKRVMNEWEMDLDLDKELDKDIIKSYHDEIYDIMYS
jgi:hypothetical protein